jgi:hypothetical protein
LGGGRLLALGLWFTRDSSGLPQTDDRGERRDRCADQGDASENVRAMRLYSTSRGNPRAHRNPDRKADRQGKLPDGGNVIQAAGQEPTCAARQRQGTKEGVGQSLVVARQRRRQDEAQHKAQQRPTYPRGQRLGYEHSQERANDILAQQRVGTEAQQQQHKHEQAQADSAPKIGFQMKGLTGPDALQAQHAHGPETPCGEVQGGRHGALAVRGHGQARRQQHQQACHGES